MFYSYCEELPSEMLVYKELYRRLLDLAERFLGQLRYFVTNVLTQSVCALPIRLTGIPSQRKACDQTESSPLK